MPPQQKVPVPVKSPEGAQTSGSGLQTQTPGARPHKVYRITEPRVRVNEKPPPLIPLSAGSSSQKHRTQCALNAEIVRLRGGHASSGYPPRLELMPESVRFLESRDTAPRTADLAAHPAIAY